MGTKNEVSYTEMRRDAEVDRNSTESRHSALQESIDTLVALSNGSINREDATREVYKEQGDRDRAHDEYERKAWG